MNGESHPLCDGCNFDYTVESAGQLHSAGVLALLAAGVLGPQMPPPSFSKRTAPKGSVTVITKCFYFSGGGDVVAFT
jgi:hypothetical protein